MIRKKLQKYLMNRYELAEKFIIIVTQLHLPKESPRRNASKE